MALFDHIVQGTPWLAAYCCNTPRKVSSERSEAGFRSTACVIKQIKNAAYYCGELYVRWLVHLTVNGLANSTTGKVKGRDTRVHSVNRSPIEWQLVVFVSTPDTVSDNFLHKLGSSFMHPKSSLELSERD